MIERIWTFLGNFTELFNKPKLCIRNSLLCTNHLQIGTLLNFLNYQTGSLAKFIKIPIAKHWHYFDKVQYIIWDGLLYQKISSSLSKIWTIAEIEKSITVVSITNTTKDRKEIARAFIAKSVYNLQST